jgi:hypothetical protein
MYWLRKRVPLALQAAVGKREEKLSLRTKDPAEAKRRLLSELGLLEARWSNLRSGPSTLTERQAHDFAASIRDWWLQSHRENPGNQKFWSTSIGGKLWDSDFFLPENTGHEIKVLELRSWCEQQAEVSLKTNGVVLDAASREKFARAIAAAMQRASVTLEQWSRGDVRDVEERGSRLGKRERVEPGPEGTRPRLNECELLIGRALAGRHGMRQKRQDLVGPSTRQNFALKLLVLDLSRRLHAKGKARRALLSSCCVKSRVTGTRSRMATSTRTRSTAATRSFRKMSRRTIRQRC